MIELAGKRVLVIGLGVTGRALARFAAAAGAAVTVAEQRPNVDRSAIPLGVELCLGPEDVAWVRDIDLVVPSPGVPRTSLLLRAAVARGIPVLSEIEIAARYLGTNIVGVTGTNGKSTVTTLIGEIFKAAGRRTFVGGNLGTPLIDAVGDRYDCAVVELSSFQLEWIESFKPHVGVYLNLSDDHLDRYRDLEEYGNFKARLFQFQAAEDWAVLNRDDPHVWPLAARVRSGIFSFGLGSPGQMPAIWPGNQGLNYEIGGCCGKIEFNDTRLPGRHNLANTMAAAACALTAGVAPGVVERVLSQFPGLAHRIERVREKHGVTFIDDSKGTNVGAVVEALATFTPPIILIAGGVDKGGDYGPLRAPLKERVKAMIVFGQAREKIRAALAGTTRIEIRDNLEQAVNCAWSLAVSGDTILLSPACSSFDQFSSYAERGQKFKELVWAL